MGTTERKGETMKTTTHIDFSKIPLVVSGEIELPAAFPQFDGDGRFWLSRFGRMNARELARVNGEWWVRWPGFSWRKADKDYM